MVKKEKIPKAIREQVWIKYIGKRYESKCIVIWCKNQISVFDFHVGHNIPESKGGSIDLTNLRPICSRCNLSMSNKFTITEWNKQSKRMSFCEQFVAFFKC
jgi:5-methylcytosine-specific restriction endonuclease McrA